MSASNRIGLGPGPRRAQAGVAAVEFALVSVIFFAFVFGILELARSMYLYNTLQEATRRAAREAAHVDFRDTARLDQIRQGAIFRAAPGMLLLGDPVTDARITIDYMAATRAVDGKMSLAPIAASTMPASPARNRVVCLNDPNEAGCIRFVRARICAAGATATCESLPYKTLFPFIKLDARLSTAPTIVSAESLGFVEGMSP